MGRRCICGFALVCAIVAANVAPASALASCSRTYSYAGYDSPWYAHGVAATITTLSDPQVAAGQVAAWVAVGGVGEGLHGANTWIQVGYAAFAGSNNGGNVLYYEVTL